MRALLALLWLFPVATAGTSVTVAPHGQDRRWVLAEASVKSSGPIHVVDEKGNEVPSQADGGIVSWLVSSVAANQKPRFEVREGPSKLPSMSLADGPDGSISIKGPDREITRFYPSAGTANKKPCFYPLMAGGVNVLRSYPLEDREGENKDHPHHTGIYHALGDVNGTEYWSKTAITHKKIVKKEAGPAFARIVAENHWGEDLVETWDVKVLNTGADAVVDFSITLRAANKPVVFAKNLKMAKEGSFGVRVATGLTSKGDAPDMLTDSKGNKGEKEIRADTAPWVHYSGTVDGKKVGVSVMNHPSSFRYPTTWHVRAYGLFAANPWIIKGENTLAQGESLALGYRVYAHGGEAAAGRPADVFAAFANAKASAE